MSSELKKGDKIEVLECKYTLINKIAGSIGKIKLVQEVYKVEIDGNTWELYREEMRKINVKPLFKNKGGRNEGKSIEKR